MKYLKYICLLILPLFLISCGAGGSKKNAGTGTSVEIKIGQRTGGLQAPSEQAVPSTASSLVIRASDGFGNIIEKTIEVIEGVESYEVVLKISNGLWHFEVFVYDGTGLICYGDTFAEITGIPVTIEMNVVCLPELDETPPLFNGIETADSLENSIDLSWFEATDNVTPSSAIIYLVYMSTTPGGQDFTMPGFVTPAGSTGYTVSGLDPGTYCFVVRAKDEAGNIEENIREKCVSVSPPVIQKYELTITKTGDGVVTSNPPGISCGINCSEMYDDGTVVKLMASEKGRSIFEGWSGHPDCEDGVVTMDADKECTANFTSGYQYTITVIIDENSSGWGIVTSSPSGIDCSGLGGSPQGQPENTISQNNCSGLFDEGETVTLTAIPDSFSYFNGWSGGGCGGSSTCDITVDSDITVTASFGCEC